MNLVEKAEKSLEYLKTCEGSAKSYELQAAAGTLGRCLGALGNRTSCARHYANLLHTAIPTLLALASNDSAEVRLVGDEALNRVVAGGFAFHAYKTNIILQNNIDPSKNARWIRAALSRICLGDCWLRPGVGKIRSQAQKLFPTLSEIVRQTTAVQLIVEALEANLPRILNALHEYTTDEEISELSKALLSHVECSEPAIRRGISNCVAHLCSHRQPLLTNILGKVFEKLWPSAADDTVVVGWFCVIKAIFQLNDVSKFAENDLFTVQDYLELYQLCIHYIEQSTTQHNIQNSVMECFSVLLSQATGGYRRALLDAHPRVICLDDRRTDKGHRRNMSYTSAISTRAIPTPLPEGREPELLFSGALHLGSVLQLPTPSLSVEDLTIQTPDSAASDTEMRIQDPEQLTKDLTEKLQEYEEEVVDERAPSADTGLKINIGSSTDEDVPLKYCARLLASKFLLTGNRGGLIPDRSVRVSVKSSALSCLSVIFQLYPQAVTLYLDKDADNKFQNYSASSEGTDSNQDNINEFILERNVCFQDSITESLSQELLKSTDSQLNSQSLQLLKKDSKSLEKSQESDQKSSKDAASNLLDSRLTKDLVASGLSADSTNPNMTNSNFTSHSNMTGSIDHMSTGYPMTSSGDILSSSIDLDMKFDHFGESTTNLDNLDVLKDFEKKERKRPLKRTDELKVESAMDIKDDEPEKEFEFQHLSELFALFEGHSDPQIRGLVRVCIGSYLSAALNVSHGDYHRWRYFSLLPKEVSDNICTEKLVDIVLKGLSDEIHSTVNHTLSSLTSMSESLCSSVHWSLLGSALACLPSVETNGYWLCRAALCRLYERLPYPKLFMLFPDYYARSKLIMETLFRLLGDHDQKVRAAASQTIANIIPKIYVSKRATPVSMMADVAKDHSRLFNFDSPKLSLELVSDTYFYNELPAQMRTGDALADCSGLKEVVGDLFGRLLASNCKNYTQGLLEALQAICNKWSPWQNQTAYLGQGIVSWCLHALDLCNYSVNVRAALLDLCRLVYPVEINNVMQQKTTNKDIFERDSQTVREKWQYLESEKVANLAEKFLQVTLKMLNVLVHLIEEVNPNVHLNKSGIALPGSPVRRKTQDSTPRKSITPTDSTEDRSIRRRSTISATSLKANFAGHFYTEPFYIKLYESLRATFSNHKINLDPKSSIFNDFLSKVLQCLAIQLEWATEREFGPVTEEILYYFKVLMPYSPNNTVYCVTQLLKCLFGTNYISQFVDYTTIAKKITPKTTTSFFDDVMLINSFEPQDEESRTSSVCSNTSQKLSLDSKNPRMVEERQLLMLLENFAKNRIDRKWSTNKKELERYIRLFEPVVIQSLKRCRKAVMSETPALLALTAAVRNEMRGSRFCLSVLAATHRYYGAHIQSERGYVIFIQSYTMHNDIPLQCSVLNLLCQLLALRVNYCMLDNDQVFIGFLMKQLDLVEQHEIPNCCDLVNTILMFLVQLSSSKHHTRQIIEIPKLIQLCDGLMASGAHAECIAGLEPVAVKVFSNMGGTTVLGRAQQQEAQATREVLFYMLQKTMHQPRVLELVSCVLSLSQEHPESYYRWSELASDTLLNLLTQRSVELDTREAIQSLERLLDSVYKDVLLEQSRVEVLLKILFKAPPDQATTSRRLKLRYLSIIMVLLRKVLILIPESEILLSINYLKSTCIAPQSIFFNVKPNVDPLNVQNFNENCANLSPDVILVRFLFKTLTYAIMEMDEFEGNIDLEDEEDKDQNRLLYSVCVNIIVQAKHMMHLTNGCLFPLTAKTAQTILHNEQSGLNTGLYNPGENIPLAALNLICLRTAHQIPLLAAHWAHLLIRLNFLSHKFWHKLIGFARNLPLSADSVDPRLLRLDLLQTACVCAYCEYFVDNGLAEAVHLSWLLVNRVHILISQAGKGQRGDSVVQQLIHRVQRAPGASGLLLQAVAARCQPGLKDEFALNTYKILSLCHETQSGALVFLICRIIGKLEPAIAVRFAKLAINRCRMLKEMPVEKITAQLSKEDVQVALELLQRDKVHVRYSTLVMELNALASSIFDLSPLDLSQDRAINAHYVLTTNVDCNWLLNQIKSRCCLSDSTGSKLSNQIDLARLMSTLSKEDLNTVMTSEFDRRILNSCFKVACDDFIREFLNAVAVRETKENEIELAREQMESERVKEEMSSSIDSNKLNVANTLHVFKKTDNKESKSQFFIPITENDIKDRFGNLQISEEETEINVPELPNLYQVGISTLDKSLADILHLFPKQNRPLSQSENFNLGIEHTIDRYTRRCHQVFQDKLFYQEFITIQKMLTGFLEAFDRIVTSIDLADCDLLEKCIDSIIPATLARNLSVFSVVSLQYLSFLIKNKNVVESPVHADVSFRVTNVTTDNVSVDHVILIAVDNVAKALRVKEIWSELNTENNLNRIQSAISCLYAIVKYLVKDTKPLVLKHYMKSQDSGPQPDIIITGDKLVTLIEYWEQFYTKPEKVLAPQYRKPLESLLISTARFEAVTNIALIPPMAWSSVEVSAKKDLLQKINLPLQAFQDMDVLESFLFRVNLIGWSSKKQFEEMWVGLLGALQGNGPHWAIRGLTQLLVSAAPRVVNRPSHVPRSVVRLSPQMQRLRSLLVGTKAFSMFDEINLERIPFLKEDFDGHFYAQFSTEYLRLASDLSDEGSFKVRREVKRKRKQKEIDVNSCLQLLMDITAEMLDPKAPTGLAARAALLATLGAASAVFSAAAHWWRAGSQLAAQPPPAAPAPAPAALLALNHAVAVHSAHPLPDQELSTVHQKLLKSLSSSYAPLRQAALQGCLIQLTSFKKHHQLSSYSDLIAQLNVAVTQYLRSDTRISLYEQSLYWAVLFTLVDLGHPDLMNIAVDFLIRNPKHYCTDIVVKGITTVLQQQILPKDLKNHVIEKILENLKTLSEDHAIQILMVHLFSADSKLISPKLESDVSNMDPDVLMSAMERITLLYKVLRQAKRRENQTILANALKYFLRETLPPAATLSRVVIEFVECCKTAERGDSSVFSERGRGVECAVLNSEVVFEVFEAAVSQNQLPVLSGWIFEALCHLLSDKLSPKLIPYCLLILLVSASSNKYVRSISPLAYRIFRTGFKNVRHTQNSNFNDYLIQKNVAMSFNDRRLLCVVATQSNFSPQQLERLKELCAENECLNDLMQCLEKL